jgi:membrane protein
MEGSRFSDTRKLFSDAATILNSNDPLRLAAATAFFTLFALPPILVILVQVMGLLFDPVKIRTELYHTLAGVIGPESVEQVVGVITGIRNLAQSWWVAIAGFIFLLFVATTLFKVIRSSLNQLWKIRVVVRRSLLAGLQNRLRAMVIILLAGLLFLAGIMAEAAQAFLGQYLQNLSSTLAVVFNGVITHLVSIIIVTIWFAVLFHHLPDGRPRWKIALMGGFVTSILFNSGKLILRWLLTHSNVQTIYGASGSIVLLLLFVFYAAIIFYYGAAFTMCLSDYYKKPIQPHSHAVRFEIENVKLKIQNEKARTDEM